MEIAVNQGISSFRFKVLDLQYVQEDKGVIEFFPCETGSFLQDQGPSAYLTEDD